MHASKKALNIHQKKINALHGLHIHQCLQRRWCRIKSYRKKLSVVCLQNIAHECNYNPRHKCKRSAGSGNGTEHSMRKNSKYGSGKKIKSAVAESGRWIESYLDWSALRIRSVVHQVRGCLHHTSKNCNSNPQIPAHLFSMSLGVVEIMPWTILGFQKVQF